MVGCLWSVKDLLVGRWSVVGGQWEKMADN